MLEALPIPPHPDPFQVERRRLVFDSPWIRLREDEFQHRRGYKGTYQVVGFPRMACGVLALDESDRVVLVGQWRYPLETYSWEIVEGGGQENESPFEAIQRELLEETGLMAKVWEPLIYHNPSNCSTDEESFIFLATQLERLREPQPDANEELLQGREPMDRCVQRVLQGEIRDGLSVIGILAFHARRQGLPSVMDSALSERFFQRPSELPSPGRARWKEVLP